MTSSSEGRFTVSGQAACGLLVSFPGCWRHDLLSCCEASGRVTQQLADNIGHGKWSDPAQT